MTDRKEEKMHCRVPMVSIVLVVALAISTIARAQERVMIFAGSASKPPTEEAATAFEKKYGVKADVTFGGSGYVLTQMELAKMGDLYFPGSSDYMEVAKKKGIVHRRSPGQVDPPSERRRTPAGGSREGPCAGA
jgi:ABC-type molybdate transport system substrate-binding protein